MKDKNRFSLFFIFLYISAIIAKLRMYTHYINLFFVITFNVINNNVFSSRLVKTKNIGNCKGYIPVVEEFINHQEIVRKLDRQTFFVFIYLPCAIRFNQNTNILALKYIHSKSNFKEYFEEFVLKVQNKNLKSRNLL